MKRSTDQLRQDALAIWQAGVDAVQSDRLVRRATRLEADQLVLGDQRLKLNQIRRIAVVGTGKAGAGMAAGVEQVLGERLLAEKNVVGQINVPSDCVRQLRRIKLVAARPSGENEPTDEGVQATKQILDLVGSLGPDDLCLCLISGGGSALMPAPAPGITLADKRAVTQHLSAGGANIEQLNTVRKQLSQIKGGGLARACRAGRLVSLIISDVLGDPLDVIASGPTVSNASTPQDALKVLDQFSARQAKIRSAVFDCLDRSIRVDADPNQWACRVTNHIIGNNAVAVDACGMEAERRGYAHSMISAHRSEGQADDVGRRLAEMAIQMRGQAGPDCLISGGEPVVTLADPAHRGKGGRNQQLVLAALDQLISTDSGLDHQPLDGIALLSGGTDGEDGPTDAAGAVIDARLAAAMRAAKAKWDPRHYLTRNDAYHFFEPLGGLIKTGPTDTNVCDIRVLVVDRRPVTGGQSDPPP